ncbi:DUF397 domain-containing protein [Kitasatospora sp. RB6PN24]|uniref:DUF397 domain-containing protein n=1 Tax=Kitasatospora humi TaxID=2893891 RepID=UPI001E5223D4|nr:DUF397 domain-containing protein [Kitasatospora humi]MCC9307227.1 DUF397 domain-containing protein [Kitasatospora humi]
MERHDPYANDELTSIQGWGTPKASANGAQCVDLIEFPNGDIMVRDTKRPDLAPLAFDKRERTAVLLSVLLGNDERFYLDEEERLAVLDAVKTGDVATALAKLKDLASA